MNGSNPSKRKVEVLARIRKWMRQVKEVDRMSEMLTNAMRTGDTLDLTFDWCLDDLETALQKLQRHLCEIRQDYRPDGERGSVYPAPVAKEGN